VDGLSLPKQFILYERSSVVEHVLHTDGVVGSIPIVRTISLKYVGTDPELVWAIPLMKLQDKPEFQAEVAYRKALAKQTVDREMAARSKSKKSTKLHR
jgi:hypothetical protein